MPVSYTHLKSRKKHEKPVGEHMGGAFHPKDDGYDGYYDDVLPSDAGKLDVYKRQALEQTDAVGTLVFHSELTENAEVAKIAEEFHVSLGRADWILSLIHI